MAPLGKRVGSLFSRLWQFTAPSTRPTYSRQPSKPDHHSSRSRDLALDEANEEVDDASDASSNHSPALFPQRENGDGHRSLGAKDVLNRDTMLILGTFLIFQLSNIAYNSLYPIFAQAEPPAGRNLSPTEIGISLAFAGLITIVFQVGLFGRLRQRIGNKTTYRVGLAGFVVAFLLMPFVGYKEKDGIAITQGRLWLWIELGVVLIIKTVAAVGGLTSALLLVSLVHDMAVTRAIMTKARKVTNTASTDYQFCAGPFGARNAERLSTNAVGCGSGCGAVSVGRAIHTSNRGTTERRGDTIWSVRRCQSLRVAAQFWDSWGEARGRRVGRGRWQRGRWRRARRCRGRWRRFTTSGASRRQVSLCMWRR